MTVPSGHRFEATQALRQVLTRAVAWGMIDVNPAKQGVDNPQRRRTEKRPFESWAQLHELAAGSNLATGRWLSSRLRPVSGRASGSPSSTETSTWTPGSSTCGGRSETGGSSARRPRAASGRCRSRRSPSKRSSYFRRRRDGSSVPLSAWRLLRPAQLPRALLEVRAARRRDQAAAEGLRSPAHGLALVGGSHASPRFASSCDPGATSSQEVGREPVAGRSSIGRPLYCIPAGPTRDYSGCPAMHGVAGRGSIRGVDSGLDTGRLGSTTQRDVKVRVGVLALAGLLAGVGAVWVAARAGYEVPHIPSPARLRCLSGGRSSGAACSPGGLGRRTGWGR